MVLCLEHGEARLLWAGSISGEVERELILEHGSGLQSGVLVQGPAKGGEANLTREWLEAVQPSEAAQAMATIIAMNTETRPCHWAALPKAMTVVATKAPRAMNTPCPKFRTSIKPKTKVKPDNIVTGKQIGRAHV